MLTLKKLLGCLALMLTLCAPALASRNAPVYQDPPPAPSVSPSEGELPRYDLTFPEEMPLEAVNFVLTARGEFEKHPFERLPKNNDYTHWFYEDEREIGWCSVFQIWCANHSGVPLVLYKQDVQIGDGDVFSAMEGRVGNVYKAFEKHGRWLDGTAGAVPRPGYLVIYGVRGSTPYTHVAIVESVRELGEGMYELTTVEGNLGSTIKRLNYRYSAAPKKQYVNMSVIPEAERTVTGCQYTLQKDDWYITGFCQTWK